MAFFWSSALAICKKDIRVWLRHPSNILITLLPAIAVLLIGALGSAAVGHSPVALVVQDNGPDGQQLAHIFHQADVFRIYDVNAQQANQMFKNVDVAAIITIPVDFSQRVQAKQAVSVNVLVNNLNLDFTDDIRRSVPDVITQFYRAKGSASPIKVTMFEHDLRSRDIELFEYTVLPIIVFLLTISGLVTGSLATAREWESKTVKELLLSPNTHGAIVIGKVMASFVTTFCLGALVFLLSYILGWLHPQSLYWLDALLIIALLSLLSSALGIALGILIQRIQPVSPISINVGMYLFFLAGGVGVLAFEPVLLQQIANVIPLTYGRHALEMAVFYNSSNLLLRDVAVMALSILLALCLGFLAMRRQLR